MAVEITRRELSAAEQRLEAARAKDAKGVAADVHDDFSALTMISGCSTK